LTVVVAGAEVEAGAVAGVEAARVVAGAGASAREIAAVLAMKIKTQSRDRRYAVGYGAPMKWRVPWEGG
jgi:hypothetical protein